MTMTMIAFRFLHGINCLELRTGCCDCVDGADFCVRGGIDASGIGVGDVNNVCWSCYVDGVMALMVS